MSIIKIAKKEFADLVSNRYLWVVIGIYVIMVICSVYVKGRWHRLVPV